MRAAPRAGPALRGWQVERDPRRPRAAGPARTEEQHCDPGRHGVPERDRRKDLSTRWGLPADAQGQPSPGPRGCRRALRPALLPRWCTQPGRLRRLRRHAWPPGPAPGVRQHRGCDPGRPERLAGPAHRAGGREHPQRQQRAHKSGERDPLLPVELSRQSGRPGPGHPLALGRGKCPALGAGCDVSRGRQPRARPHGCTQPGAAAQDRAQHRRSRPDIKGQRARPAEEGSLERQLHAPAPGRIADELYANQDKVSCVAPGVSTLDQQTERQLDGIALDQTFTDKASGKDTKRPQLELLLRFARRGDTVIVHSMDRLARNLDDLRRIVHTLTGKGVQIEFVKEQLTFTGEDSPMASLLLSVMGAFAEFERALIHERQREGIALAKQRGAYKGRKKALSAAAVMQLRTRIAAGISKAKVAREFGISRQTLYQYLQAGDGAA